MVNEGYGFFDVQRVVALDILLHGPRFILIEFGAAVPFMAVFGVFSARFSLALGLYLVTLSINYAPLLAYALCIVKNRNAEAIVALEGIDRKLMVRRYSIRQFIIFVPFSIVALAIWQAWMRR